jgi:hypothetical protein
MCVHFCSLALLVLLLASKVESSTTNDDYCDDMMFGKDETGTSACAGLSKQPTFFVCKGSIYLKQRVPSSRVGDGVCDCCDGSDEAPSSSIQCPNNCAIQEAAEKERLINIQAKLHKGIELKQASLKIAHDELKNLRNANERLKIEGPLLDEKINEISSKVEDMKRLNGIQIEDKVKEAFVSYGHKLKNDVFSFSISSSSGTAMPINRKKLEKLLSALVLRGKEELGDMILKTAEEENLFDLPSVDGNDDVDDTQVLLLAMETAEDTDITTKLYIPSLIGGLGSNNVNREFEAPNKPMYDMKTLLTNVKLQSDSLDLMTEALTLSRCSEISLYKLLTVAVIDAHDKNVLGLSLLDAEWFLDSINSEEDVDVDTHADDSDDAYETKLAKSIESIVDLVLNQLPDTPTMVRKSISNGNANANTNGSASASGTKEYDDILMNTNKQKEELILNARKADEVLKHSYGINDWLYPLAMKKECSSVYHRSYTYKVCPFNTATQDNTHLGTYASYTIGNNNKGEPEVWLKYRNGAYCHASRKSREIDIRLECSDEMKPYLTDIDEPEVCIYTAVLHTHIACIDKNTHIQEHGEL